MSAPGVAPPSEPPDEFLEFARAAFEHRECRGKAEELLGGEVTVVPQPHGTASLSCDHGIRYWPVPVAWRKTP